MYVDNTKFYISYNALLDAYMPTRQIMFKKIHVTLIQNIWPELMPLFT